jgi:hypothetical protein
MVVEVSSLVCDMLYLQDVLLIIAQTIEGASGCIPFTPRVNGRDQGQITLGASKMRVKFFGR